MQATLKDLSSNRHSTPSFAVCQRVLHACHDIIFGDPFPPQTSPYGTLSLPSKPRFSRRKVKHNVEPAMIGIGMVLAGAPAMPQITQVIGRVAVEQGRAEGSSNDYKSILGPDDDLTYVNQESFIEEDQDEEDSPDSEGAHTPVFATQRTNPSTATLPNLLAHRKTVKASQTVPALPLRVRPMRASEDPLGQFEGDVSIAYSSSPSICSSRPNLTSATIRRADTILAACDTQTQIHILRSHYCRSEVRKRSPEIV